MQVNSRQDVWQQQERLVVLLVLHLPEGVLKALFAQALLPAHLTRVSTYPTANCRFCYQTMLFVTHLSAQREIQDGGVESTLPAPASASMRSSASSKLPANLSARICRGVDTQRRALAIVMQTPSFDISSGHLSVSWVPVCAGCSPGSELRGAGPEHLHPVPQ